MIAKDTHLVGCMTDAAREVNQRLYRIKYPPAVTMFLRYLADRTFSIAGYHREWKHDEPGSWCSFDSTAWAAELGMHKANLIRIRTRLIDEGIIWFAADPARQGRGQIGWNLDFAEWKPLCGQARQWGGKRAGSGRKRTKQSPEQNQLEKTPVEQTPKQNQLENRNQLEKVWEAEINQVDYENGGSVINLKKTVLDEASPQALPLQDSAALNKGYGKERITEETLVADATQGVMFPVVEHVLPIAPKPPEATQSVPPKKERPRNELWDVMTDTLGYGPEGGEVGKWATGLQRLRSQNVDAPELRDLCLAFLRLWPNADCNPQSVYGHLGKLRHEVKKKKGAIPHATTEAIATYL